VDIQRIEFEHVDLIHLGQNRPNLRALFNTVPLNIGEHFC